MAEVWWGSCWIVNLASLPVFLPTVSPMIVISTASVFCFSTLENVIDECWSTKKGFKSVLQQNCPLSFHPSNHTKRACLLSINSWQKTSDWLASRIVKISSCLPLIVCAWRSLKQCHHNLELNIWCGWKWGEGARSHMMATNQWYQP